MVSVIINGEACGRADFSRDGAYMLCRVRAEPQAGMVRLWLYGEGEPAYLGVLQPDGSLRRRFSLSEFQRLPQPIQYCADRSKAAASAPKAAGDVLWVRQPDGSLLHDDGKRGYIAFPADGVRLPRGARVLLREIEGEQYVVFPW